MSRIREHLKKKGKYIFITSTYIQNLEKIALNLHFGLYVRIGIL